VLNILFGRLVGSTCYTPFVHFLKILLYMSMRQLKITKSITNRESQSLEKYLQEISKIPMLTADEEVQLALAIKKGEQPAFQRLISANLRFVVSVAKQYQNQGMSLTDLINEGNIGLIKAALRFDETKGFKFISYAVWWIRQSILQSLAEQSRVVRLPLNKVALYNRLLKARQQILQESEREPTIEDLSELLEIEKNEIEATLNIAHKHLSIDSPVAEGEEATLLDVLENTSAEPTDLQIEYYESLRQEMNRVLQILTDKQRQVICYFFGIGIEQPLSLEDIGRKFHLTRERVRQIKDRAIEKLQSAGCAKQLKFFLG
jgi:RNA polymerase primary sigma factor